MDIGLLWYQPDKKMTLSDKVLEAAKYYQGKYGVYPNRVFVHPDISSGELVGTIRVIPNRTIIKHHFWVGVE